MLGVPSRQVRTHLRLGCVWRTPLGEATPNTPVGPRLPHLPPQGLDPVLALALARTLTVWQMLTKWLVRVHPNAIGVHQHGIARMTHAHEY